MKWMLGPMVVATIALSACKGPEAPPPVAAVPASPSTAAVTDCGSFSLSQGESVPSTAVRCLVDAVDARQPAQLTATSPTVEGDMIPITYLAAANGEVEVVTDNRQDNFGQKIRTRMTCTGPTGTAEHARVIFGLCSSPSPIPE
jgi:hypothetical protein